MSDKTTLQTVEEWRYCDPDAATPTCQKCETHLGIRPAMFSRTGRDVWLCDTCGEIEYA